MDIIFGSWWPRSHQGSQTPAPKLTTLTGRPTATESALSTFRSTLSSTLTTALSSLNKSTHTFFNSGSSGYPSTTSSPQSSIASSISFDSFYSLPSGSSLLATVTAPAANSTASVVAAADSLFSNISLLGTHDFTEDELLFSVVGWNNSTLLLSSGNDSFFDAVSISNDSSLLAINSTLRALAAGNSSNGSFIFLSDETTWQLVEIVAKSIILGLVILATVIGE